VSLPPGGPTTAYREAAVSAESTILGPDKQYRSAVEQRLLDKVKRSPAGCWLWQGALNTMGYGQMNVRLGKWSYRRSLTHRLAYVLFCGPVETGLCVLHRCDTPLCCRPDHLFLGTKKENTQDMMVKGRGASTPGEMNASAKLTAEQVREIRHAYVPGNQQVLADRFGIKKCTVLNIVARRKWKHIPD
jgi:hypothetical protein